MEKRTTPVIKSNSTSEAKKKYSSAQEHNKKSRSSAEFQAKIKVTGGFHPLKRRGVYVEKKKIKIPINIGGNRSPDGVDLAAEIAVTGGFHPLKRKGVYVEKKKIKIPINIGEIHSPDVPVNSPRHFSRHIRRPDKKRFLANVLTLLSKSTAGTQCSDPNINEEPKIEKTRHGLKKKREEELVDDDPVTSPAVRRRTRYKSKHLKNHVDGEIDSLIILQSTKEIIQTPSNNSECVSPLSRKPLSIEPAYMSWAAPYLPPDRQDLKNTVIASHSKRARLTSSEEETGLEAKQNDKNLYNFFVDILKSTCVRTETHDSFGRPLSTNSSNVSLVIDEAVAEKLKIKKMDDIEFEAKIKENVLKAPTNELYKPPCNSTCYYSVMPYETQEWGENFKPEFSKQYKVELTKKRKNKRNISNSFQYRPKSASTSNRPRPVPKKPMIRTTSMPAPPPKKMPIKLKANNKRDFIHSIKQELQFDKEDVYEKPNFFQTLKTMAKNKKHQSISFRTYRRPSDDNVCQLRSRKVLSAKSSSQKQPKKSEKWPVAVVPNITSKNFSGYNRQAPITIYETSSEEDIHSNYSLEVIDFENKTGFKTHRPELYPPSMIQLEFSAPSSASE